MRFSQSHLFPMSCAALASRWVVIDADWAGATNVFLPPVIFGFRLALPTFKGSSGLKETTRPQGRNLVHRPIRPPVDAGGRATRSAESGA